jgi:hypothetical protein
MPEPALAATVAARRTCDRCNWEGEVPTEVHYGFLDMGDRVKCLRLCDPCWRKAKRWRKEEDQRLASRKKTQAAQLSAEEKKRAAEKARKDAPVTARFGKTRAKYDRYSKSK